MVDDRSQTHPLGTNSVEVTGIRVYEYALSRCVGGLFGGGERVSEPGLVLTVCVCVCVCCQTYRYYSRDASYMG